MQEVFEKIKDALMENAFEVYTREYGNIDVVSIDSINDVFDQMDAGYNNGWIPCSERLPEQLRPYQIQEYPVTMRAVKGKLKGEPFTSHANFDNASRKWMVKEKEYEVLAWKEPDEPYHPKGE